MTSVFRVYSTGGDSDDWIHGIYSTKELAEAAVMRLAEAGVAMNPHLNLTADFYAGAYDIEEHVLDQDRDDEA